MITWLKAWLTRRKVKALKRDFIEAQRLCQQCSKSHNDRGHLAAYNNMREIYERLRAIDPTCPAWKETRQEARREMLAQRKLQKRKRK